MAGIGLLCACLPAHSAAPRQNHDDFWRWLGPQLALSRFKHPDIDYWEARYRRRGQELLIELERGKDYLYPLALAVRDRGMPLEIALLPIIESQLDPSAVSPSGARGLWQILPSTADHLGLAHDWWYDASADFHLSTEAALNYLAALHDRFGSWQLTLAAYNGGQGRVWKQMQQRVALGKSLDFWHLDLPEQTRAYVPKLLGLARVLANPRDLNLPAVPMRRTFVKLQTRGPLDVEQIAQMAGISVGEVYALNPQLLRWTLHPGGPHEIYLPTSRADRFTAALNSMSPKQRRSWHRDVVREGDTLSAIAQRHGSRVDLLRQLNGLDSDRLKPGQRLIVANHDAGLGERTLVAARRQDRLSYQPAALPEGVHQVRRGESLWTIARVYRTSVDSLRQNNGLDRKDKLYPGQLIRIGEPAGPRRVTYTVRSGDVLSRIALDHRVSVSDIRNWNGLDSTLLRPGQTLELRLPARGS